MKGITLEEAVFITAKITKNDSVQAKEDYRKWVTDVLKTIIAPSEKSSKALRKIGIEKLK